MQGEASVQIQAPPERVWGLVTDVTRMGEWSPECRRCEWLEGASGPVVGARFRGHNQIGPAKWTTVATVVAVEPGRKFAFVTRPGEVTWRYRFEPTDGGTRATESFETHSDPPLNRLFYALMRRERALARGMRRTLDRIKAAAEAA